MRTCFFAYVCRQSLAKTSLSSDTAAPARITFLMQTCLQHLAAANGMIVTPTHPPTYRHAHTHAGTRVLSLTRAIHADAFLTNGSVNECFVLYAFHRGDAWGICGSASPTKPHAQIDNRHTHTRIAYASSHPCTYTRTPPHFRSIIVPVVFRCDVTERLNLVI